MMVQQEINALFQIHFSRLKNELEQYKHEENIWKKTDEIKNSSGNLTLHLVGNLQHFIGAVLGETGYVRNRAAEFESTNFSKSELFQKIDETALVVEKILSNLSGEVLDKTYPVQVLAEPVSTRLFLIYLVSHFTYHLGQISYHRKFF